MSPRPRSTKNKDLPANLYRANGGKTFRYRHPVTGKVFGMGADKAEAVKAAKQLNSLLVQPVDLVSNVLGAVTVKDHIAWMKAEWLPEQEWARDTISLFNTRMNDLIKAFGGKPVDEVTVLDMNEIREGRTPRVQNQIRQYANHFFRTAIARGITDNNPAEATLKRKEKKARKRLTMEQFRAIRALSPTWLRNAMDIAITTLQRREDICSMRFDWVKDGSLYVIQHKTQKYDTGYLKIAITPELDEILRGCRDSLASPFVIHRRPDRKKSWDGQQHWTQVNPDYLTNTFRDIAAQIDSIADLQPEERPTFHEVKGLGIKRYKDLGFDPQPLAGHASEAMTSNYDSGHEEIRWVEVAPNVEIL